MALNFISRWWDCSQCNWDRYVRFGPTCTGKAARTPATTADGSRPHKKGGGSAAATFQNRFSFTSCGHRVALHELLVYSPVPHVAVIEEAVVHGGAVGQVAAVLLLHRQAQAVRRGMPEDRLSRSDDHDKKERTRQEGKYATGSKSTGDKIRKELGVHMADRQA